MPMTSVLHFDGCQANLRQCSGKVCLSLSLGQLDDFSAQWDSECTLAIIKKGTSMDYPSTKHTK
eukprot:c31702_g1_i1 orf=2-190(-)